MGVKAGPKVVKDGLVFALDAAVSRSYSGSGFTIYDLRSGTGATLINGVGYSSVNSGYFSFDGTNDYINFGEEEFNSLLQFVDRGNDVFIATNGANIDSLQLETKNIETEEEVTIEDVDEQNEESIIIENEEKDISNKNEIKLIENNE